MIPHLSFSILLGMQLQGLLEVSVDKLHVLSVVYAWSQLLCYHVIALQSMTDGHAFTPSSPVYDSPSCIYPNQVIT